MKVGNIEVMVGDVWRMFRHAPVTVLATHCDAAWCKTRGDKGTSTVLSAGLGTLIRRSTDPAGETRDRERYVYWDEVHHGPGGVSMYSGWQPYGTTYRQERNPAEPPAADPPDVVAWPVYRAANGKTWIETPAYKRCRADVGEGKDGYTCVGFAYTVAYRDLCLSDPARAEQVPCRIVSGCLIVARWAIMVRG